VDVIITISDDLNEGEERRVCTEVPRVIETSGSTHWAAEEPLDTSASINFFSSISNQVRLPAELKHISKRRKRN
jgi:hypothetical protein